jgi:hypothetical protein
MTHERSVFQIALKRGRQRQQGCSHCTMPKIEARRADIESRREQSFSAGRSLLSHSVPAKGASRYHCEDVMASMFSELIPVLGVISVFIAICSREGAS